jgi:hypothetical protein
MKGFLKKISFLKRYFIFTAVVTAVFLTTCDMPMGLGDPVDTSPPLLFIETPLDNHFFRNIVQGNPITLSGTWLDDVGITSLSFEVTRAGGVIVTPTKINYSIDPSGKWNARIVLEGDGNDAPEYTIRVIGRDKFNNQGANQVTVRVDIVPPWVEKSYINRHPNNNKGYWQQTLRERDWEIYKEFNIFEDSTSYRNIEKDYIDEFQNESFTLELEIISTFLVGASRLYLVDENGEYINTAEKPFLVDGVTPNPAFFDAGLVPIITGTNQHKPRWDITATQMKNFRGAYASNAHYIQFEVHAWNEGSWNSSENKPALDALERVQVIDGTVWYPEADRPHIFIDKREIVENILVLPINTVGAFDVDFYDDDMLKTIHLGLISKATFDSLITASTATTENGYLELLTATSPTERNKALAALADVVDAPATAEYRANKGANLLPSAAAAAYDRYKQVPLHTGIQGEYRLLALVEENKAATPGFVFDGNTSNWSVYPALRVQVQDIGSPMVIVESPERENIFPRLDEDTGRTFRIRGYALDQSNNGVTKVQIAWLPSTSSGATQTVAETLLKANPGAPGSTTTGANGIKMINYIVNPPVEMLLNGKKYNKTTFDFEFDIVDFFKYNNALENANKFFVIHAFNGQDLFKTFRLIGATEKPIIDVDFPRQVNSFHNNSLDLVLKMNVSKGSSGIAIKEETAVIDDGGPGASQPFDGPTAFIDGVYQRTLSSANIKLYPEGAVRTYVYKVEDILGNKQEETRNITLSDRPILQSITCTNGPGTYGSGTVLKFQANYSIAVRLKPTITGQPAPAKPRLKLYTTSNFNSTPLYAEYDESSGGTSMTFTYTVKEGDSSALLHTSLTAPLVNPENILSTISTGDSTNTLDLDNSLQTKTQVAIDGIGPTIARASFGQLAGSSDYTSYFNLGKTITLKLYASEQVLVTGSPVAYIQYGTGNTLNTISATFKYASTETINGSSVSVLFFETAALTQQNVNKLQLSWGGSWITYPDSSHKITDIVGNPLNFAANARPSGNNLTGDQATYYPTEMAYIKTSIPGARTLTLYTGASGGAQIEITNNTVLRNEPANMRVPASETDADVYYSLQGGSSPQKYTTNQQVAITDADNANRYRYEYQPSSYSLVVWQEDVAGNRSATSTPVSVTINSRAPELQSADISKPDGWYPAGTAVDFKLTFSDKVKVPANATATIELAGTAAGALGTAAITNRPVTGSADGAALITIPWAVAGVDTPMKNIKITRITFTNMQDLYGNPLVEYATGHNDTDNNPGRGITSGSVFNITRPALGMRSARPRVIDADPSMPAAGANANGGFLAKGGTQITLKFDADVKAVPGGYITIRPYGNWAIPPVLSTDEYTSLYNYAFPTANKTDYQRRISDADANGFPNSADGTGRTRTYNLYEKNTHGILPKNSEARPDTTTKYILNFDTDLYTGNAAALRTIFNAAKWKWQEIHATSGAVTISGGLGDTVTITIDALDDGRIWEVLVDEGAFQDEAGNLSMPVAANAYRFWSGGTAKPVVRVDKISYDGNGAKAQNVALGFAATGATGNQNIPPIDTRVRIDCETPGANISYSLIRTSFIPYQATTPVTNGVSQMFVGTQNNNNFFLNGGTFQANGDNVYDNNTIGSAVVTNAANLTNGFFNKLLVPVSVETGTATLTNGAILYSSFSTPESSLKANLSNGTPYQTVNSGTGAASFNSTQYWGNSQNTAFFFVGDAYQQNGTAAQNPHIATAHTNLNLYKGRRDYVIAVAKKNAVTGNNNNNAGPVLDASDAGIEGVYKTTLLYRSPRNNGQTVSYRLLVQGFDQPITPVVAGFPLRDADTNNSDEDASNNLFSKSAYRLGGNWANTAETNHYIWVTWEIVTDWYQKGKLFRRNTAGNIIGNYLNNNNVNQNSVAATYGGVIYRYQQEFYAPN